MVGGGGWAEEKFQKVGYENPRSSSALLCYCSWIVSDSWGNHAHNRYAWGGGGVFVDLSRRFVVERAENLLLI